jgi:hypothetical protein
MKWPDVIDDKHWALFLGREYRIYHDSIAVRPPPGYVERMFHDAGLAEARPVAMPYGQITSAEDQTQLLTGQKVESYRHLVGQLLWLAPIRIDLQFIVKEMARVVSQPTEQSWGMLKKALRYLRGTRDMVLRLQRGLVGEIGSIKFPVVTGVSDTSWGSTPGFRNTSGGVVALDGFLLLSYSRTQVSRTLSSSESELIGMSSCSQEMLLARDILRELRVDPTLALHTDSSSAEAITRRRGPGRIKHVETRVLKLQDLQRSGEIAFYHVEGEHNMADVLTKTLTATRLKYLAEKCGMTMIQDMDPVKEVDEVDPVVREVMMMTEGEMIEYPSGRDGDPRPPVTQSVFAMTSLLGLVGVAAGWLCRPRRPATRTVATQSQTTYTSVRGVEHPRFVVVAEAAQGVFVR